MRLKRIRIKNFRGYQNECNIEIGKLTAVVGKNDIGKSSILEALDVFFNKGKGIIKLDKDDINKNCLSEGNTETEITAVFDRFPAKLIIDSTNETSLDAEFLLNSSNELEVIKRYKNGGAEKVFIKANHPSNENCHDLLFKKQNELKKIVDDSNIECESKTRNAVMRVAIWNHYSTDLNLSETEIDVTKGDTKSIWEKLEGYLPLYSLFQSDRKNSDSDSEVQDPLTEAVRQIMNADDIKESLSAVAEKVESKLRQVADLTLEKLREMNPDIADSLNPVIPATDTLKWSDVFKKVSISGDNDIPINKRGSGVKRLILLNFFRAEAERRRTERNVPSIIYAIEEPETSQHTEHQKILVKALIQLSAIDNTQIILTTHSPTMVKGLEFEHLRLVSILEEQKSVVAVTPGQLPYPSLNEVIYVAFSEITEEYHNELYGFIEAEEFFTQYKEGRETMPYLKLRRNGSTIEEQKVLTEYIRHQIHHPENTHNARFSAEQLADSIVLMRAFIQNEM